MFYMIVVGVQFRKDVLMLHNPTISRNSGGFYQQSGYISGLLYYVSRAPYERAWMAGVALPDGSYVQGVGRSMVAAVADAFTCPIVARFVADE
jgi:hypothetical protein